MPRTLFDFFSPKSDKSESRSKKNPLKIANRDHTEAKHAKLEVTCVSTDDGTKQCNKPISGASSSPHIASDNAGHSNKVEVQMFGSVENNQPEENIPVQSHEAETLVETPSNIAAALDSASDGEQIEDVNKIKHKRSLSQKMARKRRCIESSSESENNEPSDDDEFVPTNLAESSDYESEGSLMEAELSGNDNLVKVSRKRKRASSSFKACASRSLSIADRIANASTSKSPSLSLRTKSRLSVFQAADHEDGELPKTIDQTQYLHETLEFLYPDKIQDKYGRKPSDPEYDPTTLKVPSDFLKKLSPAMSQWWKLKSENFDIILCFKVGKFYELYHMDAVVGVNELGLVFMKGNFAHSGFPEIAFGRYSDTLVNKGYKVGRVEQTETPDQNALRIKKNALPRQEKTLRREICRIITKGTQSLGSLTSCKGMNSGNNFLLAITERQMDQNNDQSNTKSNLCRQFGVCFVDTSVGVFNVGQFVDDRYCSSLCTMLCRNPPSQVLYERGRMSCSFQKILKSGLSSTLQEALNSGSQFWSSAKTVSRIRKEGYFSKDGNDKWPDALKKMMKDPDAVSLSASDEYDLAISAFGASIFYLQKCLFDHEVVSLGQIVEYRPQVLQPTGVDLLKNSMHDFVKSDSMMILDSVTLHNLEILQNSVGGTEGTLRSRLDSCYTTFGKRLLKQWLCAPPCNPDVSNDRLDAIDDLCESVDFVVHVTEILKAMPDLERMLMKIHALSKGARKLDHPENRAVFYEEEKYSKRNIEDFLAILKHYKNFHQLLERNQSVFSEFKSKTLKNCLCFSGNSGGFPDLKEVLNHWKTAFNHKKALETGKITPSMGANPEYDEAVKTIEQIKKELASYLREQKRALQCFNIVYKGSGNKRYQLELPMDAASRIQSSQYTISGQRKGYKSFRTAETTDFLKRMERAETQRDSAQADTLSILFREFDQDHSSWRVAIESMSVVDVLISLMQYCKNNDSEMCRPVFVWNGPDTSPFVDIRDGRHPSMSRTFLDDDFIPNDTVLGGKHGAEANQPACLVLTGPNMGGKSTLMRQVGLIVVLAHLGCRVPASSCVLSPVDRVFTRLGASDRILSGESTFHVEMSETSSILRHATKHSLVLLDELGRGTATYDGSAIASAVIQEMADSTKCRTIFSTHYHSLVDDLKSNENVFQGHMACMVENEDVSVDDPSQESLTFLYKLSDGPCPKSYGFHAARLADLPESAISLAYRKAAQLESDMKNMAAFSKIHRLQTVDQIKQLLSQC